MPSSGLSPGIIQVYKDSQFLLLRTVLSVKAQRQRLLSLIRCTCLHALPEDRASTRHTHLRLCVGVHGCDTCSFTGLLRFNPTQQGSFEISPFFNSAGRQLPFPVVQYVWVTSQSFKSYYGEEENQREELKYTVCLLV